MAFEPKTERYGCFWDSDDLIQIECEAIRRGGKWLSKSGKECGAGLYHHYKSLQSLLWPHKRWHRWNELLLKHYIQHRIVAVLGPASSGKTHEAADWALSNYIVWPEELTILVSSTDSRSLELRIWGQVKKSWDEAKNQYEHMPGALVASKQMISTDGRDSVARDFRNGIVGIPCVQNGTYVGLGKYVGVKNKRLMLIADEAQFMASSFFDAISNLNKNIVFQCVAMGNPKDRTDALGKIAEPANEEGGWDGLDEPIKTTTWRTRFANGVAINLVGTDSPNFDVPEGKPVPFPFLITRQAIKEDEEFYGRESLQFSMMNKGVMPKDAVARRVITRMICEKFGAREDVVWEGSPITKVAGLDAAYGNVGGDRCVFCELNFGRDRSGRQVLAFVGQPIIVPVSVRAAGIAEDQIANFVKTECERRGIAPENLFFDSTGRGTLTTAFARIWSASVNPVEFGGPASDRRVAADTKKLCKDHFSKFVSELWFAVRLIIESGQFKALPEDVMNEGCMREWRLVPGPKVEVEPKENTKLRMGRSPDLFDALVAAVEGARQRGFTIAHLGGDRRLRDRSWLQELQKKADRLNQSKQLAYV